MSTYEAEMKGLIAEMIEEINKFKGNLGEMESTLVQVAKLLDSAQTTQGEVSIVPYKDAALPFYGSSRLFSVVENGFEIGTLSMIVDTRSLTVQLKLKVYSKAMMSRVIDASGDTTSEIQEAINEMLNHFGLVLRQRDDRDDEEN